MVSGEPRARSARSSARARASGVVGSRRCRVSHAFHSPLVAPAAPALAACLAGETLRPRSSGRVVSTVTGDGARRRRRPARAPLLARSRAPVRFARGRCAARRAGRSLSSRSARDACSSALADRTGARPGGRRSTPAARRSRACSRARRRGVRARRAGATRARSSRAASPALRSRPAARASSPTPASLAPGADGAAGAAPPSEPGPRPRTAPAPRRPPRAAASTRRSRSSRVAGRPSAPSSRSRRCGPTAGCSTTCTSTPSPSASSSSRPRGASACRRRARPPTTPDATVAELAPALDETPARPAPGAGEPAAPAGRRRLGAGVRRRLDRARRLAAPATPCRRRPARVLRAGRRPARPRALREALGGAGRRRAWSASPEALDGSRDRPAAARARARCSRARGHGLGSCSCNRAAAAAVRPDPAPRDAARSRPCVVEVPVGRSARRRRGSPRRSRPRRRLPRGPLRRAAALRAGAAARCPRRRAAEPRCPWARGDVLLVTGGGKGIAAECALALARADGRAARAARPLRTRRPTPSWPRTSSASPRPASTVRYVAADVTDRAAVRRAVRDVAATLGPVTAVLHGAGRNVPALLALARRATRSGARSRPKVGGARARAGRGRSGRLKLLVAFGSIIARAGLRGEADYAVANEWLTPLGRALRRARTRRAAASRSSGRCGPASAWASGSGASSRWCAGESRRSRRTRASRCCSGCSSRGP